MPTITFGITDKRVNSTGTSMSNTIALNCKLKEPCSYNNPVFIVSGLGSSNYNFCSWGSYYYWIDDITITTNDIKEVTCHLDPLATFRTSILNTKAYVMFGDNNHASKYKDDIRFGADHKRTRPSGETGTGYFDMGFDRDNWSFIMTVQCSTSAAYSSVITYAMTSSVFQKILKGFSGTVYSDITNWSSTDFFDIIKNFALKLFTGGGQAIDNIKSVICVPININTFANHCLQTLNYVYLGPYSITLETGSVYVMDSSVTLTGNGVIDLHRPIASTTYKWLNSPKYCSIQITHPCGYQEINCNGILENTQLYLWWSLNLCSGEYSIRVTSEASKDSETIALINGSTGIDVMGFVTAGGNNVIDQLFNNTANALTGGLTSGLLSVDAGKMSPSGMGNSVPCGFAGIYLLTSGKECFYDVEYYLPSILDGTINEYVAYCDEYGYPVGRYMTIGDISGYCQCKNASVSGASGATDSAKELINSYLNNGIYLE